MKMDAQYRFTGSLSTDAERKSPPGIGYVFILTGLACGIAILHRCHLAYLFESDRHFSHLSTLERELTFRTELGLYYSYYKTLVEASDIRSGIWSIMNDNRTEYPDTINTLYRFNLYPELVASVGYRGFMFLMSTLELPTMRCWRVERGQGRDQVVSCEGPGEPMYFYVEMAFLLNGILVGVMFIFGTYLSGSMFGGILTVLSYVYNHRECTRVQWTPALRESFAYPFYMFHLFAVVSLIISSRVDLSRPSGRDSDSKTCIPKVERTFLSRTTLVVKNIFSQSYDDYFKMSLVAITAVCFMVSWQFAQFALLTTTMSVFTLNACGMIDNISLGLIAGGQLIGFIISFCMLFGNRMLIVSYLFSALILCLLFALFNSNEQQRLTRWKYRISICVKRCIVLVIGMVVLKASLSYILSVEDDSHITDLLRSKLTSFKNFHTMLYTCAAEFDFLPFETVVSISKTLLLPTVIVVLVVIAVCICNGLESYKEYSVGSDGKQDQYKCSTSDNKLRSAERSDQDKGYETEANASDVADLNNGQDSENYFIHNANDGTEIRRRFHPHSNTTQSIDEPDNSTANSEDKNDSSDNDLDSDSDKRNIYSSSTCESINSEKLVSAHSTLTELHSTKDFQAVCAFLTLQLGSFMAMAGMFMRLKLFFTPHLCLMSSLLASRQLFCRWLSQREHFVVILVVAGLMSIEGFKGLQEEWDVMGEFNDVRMEHFIEWIGSSTPQDAVFAGPMSTMATVKLCTGRRVVNHPHYEHADLRQRTLEVYTLFSRKHPHDVWLTLRNRKVDYAVLERVWCYGQSREGCSMADIWDIHDPENRNSQMICELLMKDPKPYFQRVFRNDAFDVLQVNYDIVQ